MTLACEQHAARVDNPKQQAVIGVAGGRRHGCVAVWRDGVVHGVCELERVTRSRGEGLAPGELPAQTLTALDATWRDTFKCVVSAESDIVLPQGVPAVRLGHHEAHAAAAFLTSPFETAVVLVCDSHPNPPLSVWVGAGTRLERLRWPWTGPAFAEVYSASADVLGLTGPGKERALEALARGAPSIDDERMACLWRYGGDRLILRDGWRACLAESVTAAAGCHAQLAAIARSIQCHLGSLLLELLADVRTSVTGASICLAGGLFHNSYFNTVVQQSGLFARTFVPINPGNAGLAVGTVLAATADDSGEHAESALSPFLGPGFSCEDIKAVLDNCKLNYDFLTEQQIVEQTVDVVRGGKLVAWFHGRMEWGPRALGHRSILADPLADYVLENLNIYLKKRHSYQAFSVSVLDEDVDRCFDGPPQSPYMEYEYRVRDSEMLRAVMPAGARALRVQSIGATPSLFRQLHEAYRGLTGAGVLVNTSFNGFCEPIVCTPRDAIRVFYGTGLDMLVLGQFVLQK